MGAFSNLCRLMRFAIVLAPFARAKARSGERAKAACQRLGPAAIKLGQALATRADIVGPDIAGPLAQLQDRLPPFSTDAAKHEIEAAFGAEVETLFSAFGDSVAAASIAQVHKAITPDGRTVAVKVLRPGITAAFARDMAAFAFAAKIAERVSPEARRLRLEAVVETLKDSVAIELDLRMEAAAASELAENCKTDEGFRVPAVDWTRTAKTVLTTEWIDGVPIRDVAALIAAGHDPKAIAVRLMRRFLKMALCDGFFHADLHPGNLFVMADGRLAAVDFGIMGRLDAKTRRFMADVLMGFLSRDYARVAKAHFDYGTVSKDHSIDLFAQNLRAIVEPIFGRHARELSIAGLLGRLFDTTRAFGMQTQPQLILLQKTMVVAEGVCRALDPDFDMWAAARPVAEDWLREQTGPLAKLKDVAETFRALASIVRNWSRSGA